MQNSENIKARDPDKKKAAVTQLKENIADGAIYIIEVMQRN